MAQSGSALRLGRKGRRFESFHSDIFERKTMSGIPIEIFRETNERIDQMNAEELELFIKDTSEEADAMVTGNIMGVWSWVFRAEDRLKTEFRN